MDAEIDKMTVRPYSLSPLPPPPLPTGTSTIPFQFNTAAADCAKSFLQDFIDFVADLHVLHRMKVGKPDPYGRHDPHPYAFQVMARGSGMREDTLGGELKAGLARFVAYEISRANSRDPRTIIRYLPWLLSPPSVTQQG